MWRSTVEKRGGRLIIKTRNKKRLEDIITLAEQGFTRWQIAKRLGIAYQTVLYWENCYHLDISTGTATVNRDWSEEDEAYLAYALEDNHVVLSEVAEALGRSLRAVHNKIYDLRRRGIIREQTGQRYSDRELAKLVKYYNKIPLIELAHLLGRSAKSVQTKASKLGLTNQQDKGMIDAIKALATEGYYLNQIAQQLGCSHSLIIYYENTYGFKVPRETAESKSQRSKKNNQRFFSRSPVHYTGKY